MKPLLIGVTVIGLAGSAFAATTPVADKPGANRDKLVCKREVPIGSLIATRKVCLTREQWRKRQDDGNATARSLVEEGAGACGQNGGLCPF